MIKGKIKSAIVTLAQWRIIPAALAALLIQHGGLRNE